MRSSRSNLFLLVGALALPTASLVGCGPGRTAAATQSTPAAFDASKSEPKAVAIADQVLAAVGGEAAWAKARQLSWTHKVTIDGKEVVNAHHDWDRWNGRHRYTKTDAVSKAELMVAYEIFGDAAHGEIDGRSDIAREQVTQMKGEAVKRLQVDAYLLTMPYRLKDPGVTLKYAEERAEPAAPETPVYDVLKVTFDPGVGPTPGDVYYVIIGKDDHLIRHIEFVEQGKADNERIGYRFEEWQDVNGLKISTRRQNIGYAAEKVEISDIVITDEPSDDLYIRQVK